jgi:hypothetical protein
MPSATVHLMLTSPAVTAVARRLVLRGRDHVRAVPRRHQSDDSANKYKITVGDVSKTVHRPNNPEVRTLILAIISVSKRIWAIFLPARADQVPAEGRGDPAGDAEATALDDAERCKYDAAGILISSSGPA